jgi:hypothetical protein
MSHRWPQGTQPIPIIDPPVPSPEFSVLSRLVAELMFVSPALRGLDTEQLARLLATPTTMAVPQGHVPCHADVRDTTYVLLGGQLRVSSVQTKLVMPGATVSDQELRAARATRDALLLELAGPQKTRR